MNISFKEMLIDNDFSLIVSLPANSYELASAAWKNGADAIKVHINVEHRASKTSFKSFDEERTVLEKIMKDSPVPVGIVAGGDTASARTDFKKIVNMGFSFVSLYLHHTAPIILKENNIDKMMAADYTYTVDELNKFKGIGVDIFEASVISPEGYGQPLNMRDILRYMTIVENVNIPVIIPTQRNIQREDLQCLYDLGAKGIMIGAITTGKDVDSIASGTRKFKQEIDKLCGRII